MRSAKLERVLNCGEDAYGTPLLPNSHSPMNAPERSQLWVLPEGEKKVQMEKDTKIPNAANFTIRKEDHTVGNLLRLQLLRDDTVFFAGYKLPHPLEQDLLLKIQTKDHPASPVKALRTACDDLRLELEDLKEKFEEKVKDWKQKHDDMTDFS